MLEKIEKAELSVAKKVERAEVSARENPEHKRYLQDLKNQALSVEKVKKTTKPCPWCDMPIEKNGGCNYMVCTYCHTDHCYRCGEVGISYGHFGAGSCIIFSQDAIDEWEAETNPDQVPHYLLHLPTDSL